MGFGVLARVGAGVNPEAMHAERVDGYNPLAVADAIERKKQILLEGRGPVLLDVITYRFSGHSPSDAGSYRTKEEVDLWQQEDCIEGYGAYLVGQRPRQGRATWRQLRREVVRRTVRGAASWPSPPRCRRASTPGATPSGELMFSNRKVERFAERAAGGAAAARREPARQGQRSASPAPAWTRTASRCPRPRCLALRDALFEAMLHRFYVDPTMVAYGEENRDWGGAFAVYRGLTEALPYHRLFNTPISEGAIVGTAVGYALCGGRVVAELMYCDFMGRAGDEIFNQMSKWQSMSAGVLQMPLVLRVSVGTKYGAQHSQDWTSIVAHIPGLKVVLPGHALRRQGHAQPGPARHRPGGLLREPAPLRHRRAVRQGRRAGGLLRGAGRRAGRAA